MLRLTGGLVVACVLLVTVGARAQPGDYAGELVEASRELGLAEDMQWLRLGHYLPGLMGIGYRSVIDSPGFFNAPGGKTEPRAELEATIAAFFMEDALAGKEQHAQCAFIARYTWLKSKLGFDPARLTEQACPRFERWYTAIDPGQVTLIFPAAYINQPSSMFGHTLLRLDRPGQPAGTNLTSYAINYAAETGEQNGFIFAVKGLTGGYRGFYSIMPYYEKVKEYSDLENRDIWEYRLNLEPAQIRRLLMNVWELGQEHADYYFFDDNCSYQLLALLETARPDLSLTDAFDWWAIPSDTVRKVIDQSGLVESAVFRPSAQTELRFRLDQLGDGERDLVDELARGEREPGDPALDALEPANRARVLDAAYEYVRYLMTSHDMSGEEAGSRSLRLLRARSLIEVAESTPQPPTPDARPDEGHDSARIAVGGGALDDRAFVEFRIRPSYHDLLDPPAGFVPGAQIEFLDVRVRLYEEDGRENSEFEFESLTLVNIASLSPRNGFFTPISWRAQGGAERYRRGGAADGDLVLSLAGGGGLSYAPWSDAILSVFADAQGFVGENLRDKWLVTAGPGVQLIYYPTGWWTLGLNGDYLIAPGNRAEDYASVSFEQGFSLNRSLALRVGTAYRGPVDDGFFEFGTWLHWYF